jgi:intron-binding protein aquarius
LVFLIYAFQSLDASIVRKECAPLVSISIWHNLSSDSLREAKLSQNPHLKKLWRAALKRYDAADEAAQARLRFERSWLYTLTLDFLGLIYDDKIKPGMRLFISFESKGYTNCAADDVLYCERFLEFLSDLLSQLPTRRYVNTLLNDLHVLPAARLSPVFHDEDHSLFRDLLSLLSHYTFFTIDDQTGVQNNRTEAYERHCATLKRLQKVALKHFKDKLTVLGLSNYGAIDKREELENLLEPLTDDEVTELATLLDLRTSYPETLGVTIDRSFLLEVLLSTFERRKTFQEVAKDMAMVPTEQSLFENALLRTDSYDGSRPMALPKLNLQYLSVGDFLWRSLILYRVESFYEIRNDIESVIRRLKPETRKSGEIHFGGFSKMAIPTSKPR